jgi:Ca2+-binding RTX toxin-like protein
MRTMRLALVLSLLLVAPAQAASVSGGNPLVITGAPGEVNTVTVQDTETGIIITDGASELSTDADGCTATTAHLVSCEGTYGGINADLGDLDDQLTVIGTYLTLGVAGGDGNDSLDINEAEPFARDARFTVSGNDGDDELRGGDADEIFVGGPGSDAIDGAGGLDEVDYSDHADDIVVNLTREGGQGALGEGDFLTSIESVFGGLGDDVLIGDEGANGLRGNEGRDKVRGGAGPDSLDGEGEDITEETLRGHDDVRGGAGADIILVGPRSVARGDKGADRVVGTRSRLFGGTGRDFMAGDTGRTSCGAGQDTASIIPRPDFVAPDCERISLFDPTQLYLDQLSRRGFVRLACVDKPRFCRGRIRVGRAHARFRLQPGQPQRIRLHGPRPRGRVTVRITGADPIRYVTRL